MVRSLRQVQGAYADFTSALAGPAEGDALNVLSLFIRSSLSGSGPFRSGLGHIRYRLRPLRQHADRRVRAVSPQQLRHRLLDPPARLEQR